MMYSWLACLLQAGVETNNPAMRFGNISLNPTPIEQPNQSIKDSYCLDMNSRTGFSGSPVFMYRTPGSDVQFIDNRPAAKVEILVKK